MEREPQQPLLIATVVNLIRYVEEYRRFFHIGVVAKHMYAAGLLNNKQLTRATRCVLNVHRTREPQPGKKPQPAQHRQPDRSCRLNPKAHSRPADLQEGRQQARRSESTRRLWTLS